MKISYLWLKEYLDLPSEATPAEIAKRLTFSGCEVDALTSLAQGLEKVVVGQILERKQHPNADRLSLTVIDVGGPAKLEIVCGAQNIKAGQKIPVATLGALLPNGLEIKAAKIRGVPSQGMLCSLDELLLPKDWQAEDGIFLLDEKARIGQPLADYLERNDWIFEINVTPNRGDVLSHVGMAREIGALFGLTLKLPDAKIEEKDGGRSCEVSISAKEFCPRYMGRLVESVKIGPSPAWLRQRIEAIGLRSINNVVDVTSYVMFEIGQPLHAFDADKLSKDKIRIDVRAAKGKEAFVTLTDKTVELEQGDLLITDGNKAVALAGVMGGKNSEVDDNTKNIFIEAAEFQPVRVRKTGRRLDLLTDAGYRFERGIDPARVEWALNRATALIQKVAGGTARKKVSAKENLSVEAPLQMRLRLSDLQRTLGKAPDLQQVIQIFRGLGIQAEIAAGEQDVVSVQVPQFRHDLKRNIDLVEEVVRIWGFEHLSSRLPLGGIGAGEALDSRRRSYFQLRRIRRHLASLGFFEALNYGFTSHDILKKIFEEKDLANIVEVANPVTTDYSVMKPSLLSGLLENVGHNFSHRRRDLRMFEARRVFQRATAATHKDARLSTGVEEEMRLAFLMTGSEVDESWQGKSVPVDFYSLKGVIDSLSEMLALKGFQFRPNAEVSYLHPGQSAQLLQGNNVVGVIGRLHPRVEKNFEIDQDVYFAEIRVDALVNDDMKNVLFKSYSNFPEVERDFSVQVKDSVNAQMIRANVTKAAKALLRDFYFFDVYKGSRVSEGHVSYAFRVVLGAEDHTLADAEISQAQEKIMKELEKEFQAKFAGLS